MLRNIKMEGGMTNKQKVENIAREHNLDIELHRNPRDNREIWKVEVYAPDGYQFAPELTGLICKDWKDALERLPHYIPLQTNR